MKRKTKTKTVVEQEQLDIPVSAVREYIMDMSAELCAVAKQGGQEDLYILLKLTTQAARNTA